MYMGKGRGGEGREKRHFMMHLKRYYSNPFTKITENLMNNDGNVTKSLVNKIKLKAFELVPIFGWRKEAFRQGARQLGISPAIVPLIYKDDMELIRLWNQISDNMVFEHANKLQNDSSNSLR